ncbi:MAG: hypothetical protein ACR2JC_19590 [Chloroflexota bacterium]
MQFRYILKVLAIAGNEGEVVHKRCCRNDQIKRSLSYPFHTSVETVWALLSLFVHLPEKLVGIAACKHASTRSQCLLHFDWVVVLPDVLGRFFLDTKRNAISVHKNGLTPVLHLLET